MDGRCPWVAPVELIPFTGQPLHHFALTNTPPGAAAAPPRGVLARCGVAAYGAMEFLRTGTFCPWSRELPQNVAGTLRRQGEGQHLSTSLLCDTLILNPFRSRSEKEDGSGVSERFDSQKWRLILNLSQWGQVCKSWCVHLRIIGKISSWTLQDFTLFAIIYLTLKSPRSDKDVEQSR